MERLRTGASVADVRKVGWERRRQHEPTADYLGRVLDDYLGLDELAGRARMAHFDDFFAPREIADGAELLRLVGELERAKTKLGPDRRRRVDEVIDAVKTGEFDGTREESDRWAASKDGQDALHELADAIYRGRRG